MIDFSDLLAEAALVDDVEARRQGIRFIDGSIPGYALMMGNDTASISTIIKDLSKRQIVVFVTEDMLRNALEKDGQALSWDSEIVPLNLPQALGFVLRMAQVFSSTDSPQEALDYANQRLRGFTLLVGEPTPERLDLAQAALSLGCPLVSTNDLPSAIAKWELPDEVSPAIGGVDLAEIVQTGIEERGLQIHIPLPELPVAYSPDFAGQFIRDDACGACLSGVELTITGEDIIDGRVRVVGPDLDSGVSGSQAYGLLIEVSGREMQPDFESVLERQIETILNDIDGVSHRGQRTIVTLRIAQKTIDKGLRLHHLGQILHARYHNDFGSILSRVQITIFTEPAQIQAVAEKADVIYQQRDQRLVSLTDEKVDTFYTCTLCQSIAGEHLCVISPEHPGVCGAVDWMDARAAVNIRPVGPNKAVQKKGLIDASLGQWESVNQIVQQETGGALATYSLYSLMQDPSPACGDFECITAMLPLSNGVMVVERNFEGMTPSGMDWEMLYEIVGTGTSVPGFIGHSKRVLHRGKFISAEGGWRRIVWMNYALREELRPVLDALAAGAGVHGFVDMIATEENALSEDEVLAHMEACGHPALMMDPMI